jgi:hypothetical protein
MDQWPKVRSRRLNNIGELRMAIALCASVVLHFLRFLRGSKLVVVRCSLIHEKEFAKKTV